MSVLEIKRTNSKFVFKCVCRPTQVKNRSVTVLDRTRMAAKRTIGKRSCKACKITVSICFVLNTVVVFKAPKYGRLLHVVNSSLPVYSFAVLSREISS